MQKHYCKRQRVVFAAIYADYRHFFIARYWIYCAW